MDIIFYITIFLFATIIVVQQIVFYKTVKDITTKIKAKDLGEYERISEKKKVWADEPLLTPADEADETEYLDALIKKVNNESK